MKYLSYGIKIVVFWTFQSCFGVFRKWLSIVFCVKSPNFSFIQPYLRLFASYIWFSTWGTAEPMAFPRIRIFKNSHPYDWSVLFSKGEFSYGTTSEGAIVWEHSITYIMYFELFAHTTFSPLGGSLTTVEHQSVRQNLWLNLQKLESIRNASGEKPVSGCNFPNIS